MQYNATVSISNRVAVTVGEFHGIFLSAPCLVTTAQSPETSRLDFQKGCKMISPYESCSAR